VAIARDCKSLTFGFRRFESARPQQLIRHRKSDAFFVGEGGGSQVLGFIFKNAFRFRLKNRTLYVTGLDGKVSLNGRFWGPKDKLQFHANS
jgi:hypothetical protein